MQGAHRNDLEMNACGEGLRVVLARNQEVFGSGGLCGNRLLSSPSNCSHESPVTLLAVGKVHVDVLNGSGHGHSISVRQIPARELLNETKRKGEAGRGTTDIARVDMNP